MLTFFVGLCVGVAAGIAIVAMMQANDVAVQTCPKCHGIGGFETGPNDWQDCDLCDATGLVRKINELEENTCKLSRSVAEFKASNQ